MTPSDILFIHPLLGPDDGWSGYRIEFASDAPSADTLLHLCQNPLLDEFDRRHIWFVPALPAALDQASLRENWVIVFSAQAEASAAEALQQLETSLRQAQCKVGLLAVPDKKLPGAGAWDYLLISASHARSLPPYALLGITSRTIVVATEVHNHNDRDWVQNNGCALSTSEFLLARLTSGKKADMSRVNLLEMLALITEDADTDKLEAIFRRESKLSYSLLRLVNSAAIAPRNPITSFAQAINLLGRRQLQRWLQLLVYADPNNGQHPNPLLQKAAARGRQMELLAQHLNPPLTIESLEDTAFMVGTFSLLDTLLNMPLKEILQQLPLTETVHNALAERAGGLGQLLGMMDAVEAGDLPRAAKKINELGISGANHCDAQLAAYNWAARIRPAT